MAIFYDPVMRVRTESEAIAVAAAAVAAAAIAAASAVAAKGEASSASYLARCKRVSRTGKKEESSTTQGKDFGRGLITYICLYTARMVLTHAYWMVSR